MGQLCNFEKQTKLIKTLVNRAFTLLSKTFQKK